jgi:hypothetical protein
MCSGYIGEEKSNECPWQKSIPSHPDYSQSLSCTTMAHTVKEILIIKYNNE